jgi:hypothetical protein
MRGSHGAVDEQRFRSTTDAGAAHLGVDGNPHRHVEVSRPVDVEMADAFQMREHRHAGFGLYPLDEAAATARNDHVQIAAQALQHLADGSAVADRHELDGVLRQARGLEPFDETGVNGAG